MATTIKSNKTNGSKRPSSKAIAKEQATETPVIPEGEQRYVLTAEIDFSPLNYRKFYSHKALDDFGAELKLHGIIHPLTVRPMPTGRYELAMGERRLRAAQIGGLQWVPVVIKPLTDAEIIELQLAENLQRENPHPMNEAQAIGSMLTIYKTVDEVAARLVKSRQFVYARKKLLDLIEPFQEMFFSDVITMQEAYDVATLSRVSQQQFFDAHCENWRHEDFSFSRHVLSRFRCDLKQAPFNTKDKKLLPDVGACTNCPFNSATLKSLFPEMAEKAICTKRECFNSKCQAHYTRLFETAFREHEPQAIIFSWQFTAALQEILSGIPGVSQLPQYSRDDIAIVTAPGMPDKEDFLHEVEEFDDEDYEVENDYDTAQVGGFDEAGYQAALYEYEADMEEYNRLLQSGELIKGLLVSDTKADPVMISPTPKKNNGGGAKVTAKEVQEAIKAGKATPELLQSEIKRIQSREIRAKELDEEKVQVIVHRTFADSIDPDTINALTDEDLTAARLLVYQSLDWSAKNKVSAVLFSNSDRANDAQPTLYEQLQGLTDQQYSYLIRMAIGCKSEGKYPTNDTGQTIRKVAEGAGVDVGAILQKQQQIAEQRKDKIENRVQELETKITRLNAKAGLKV